MSDLQGQTNQHSDVYQQCQKIYPSFIFCDHIGQPFWAVWLEDIEQVYDSVNPACCKTVCQLTVSTLQQAFFLYKARHGGSYGQFPGNVRALRIFPASNMWVCHHSFFATAPCFSRLRPSSGEQGGYRFSCPCSRNETRPANFWWKHVKKLWAVRLSPNLCQFSGCCLRVLVVPNYRSIHTAR